MKHPPFVPMVDVGYKTAYDWNHTMRLCLILVCRIRWKKCGFSSGEKNERKSVRAELPNLVVFSLTDNGHIPWSLVKKACFELHRRSCSNVFPSVCWKSTVHDESAFLNFSASFDLHFSPVFPPKRCPFSSKAVLLFGEDGADEPVVLPGQPWGIQACPKKSWNGEMGIYLLGCSGDIFLYYIYICILHIYICTYIIYI